MSHSTCRKDGYEGVCDQQDWKQEMVMYTYLETLIILNTAHCTLLRINNVNNSSNVTNTKQRLIYTDNIYYNVLHTLYHSQVTATCFDQHVAVYKEYTQRVDLVKNV